MNDENKPESLGPMEFVPEVVESTDDHHYSNDTTIVAFVSKEQTILAVIGLILALPFPILIIVLWGTLDGIKDQPQTFGAGAVNTVSLYLFQFFVVPILSIASIIIAFIVTIKSKEIAKKIGYISMGVTAVGFVILGLFLNQN